MKLDRGKSCLRFKGEGPAAEEGGFEDRRQSRGKAERDPQVRCEEGREEKDVVPGFPEERRRLMRPSEGIIFMLQQLALIALGSALTLCAVALATAQEAPSTMKAIRMHEFGGPETLRLEEAPVPTPAPGEVLVRVYAAGVNPVDWKIRSGMIKAWAQLPYIPGFDVSGVVAAVGEGVTDVAPGDEVYSYIAVQRGGAYAQYVAIPSAWVAPKPASLTHAEAAAVPLAALTAWQALFEQAKLEAGQTVLIHAGAGGVGHFAVQLAHAKGAKVIATASARNHEFLKSIGADVVIDYRTQKFEDVAKDVDVVLDTIGGETQARSLGVLKKGGFLASIVQPPDPAKLAERGLRGSVMLVAPNAAQLSELGAMIDAGKVRPEISTSLPLAEAAEAHRLSEQGRTRGKIVLDVP